MRKRLFAAALAAALLSGCAGRVPEPPADSSRAAEMASPAPAVSSSQAAGASSAPAAEPLPGPGNQLAQGDSCLMLADRLLMTQAPEGEQSASQQLIQEFRERMLVTLDQGPNAPGGIEELVEQSPEAVVFPNARMFEVLGMDSAAYHYERANAFFENHRAGQADSLVVVGSGGTLILNLEVLRTEKGTLTRYLLDLDDTFLQTVETVSETEAAWKVGGKPEREWGMQFPKYGLVPVLIAGQAHPATPQEAAQALQSYLETDPSSGNWPEGELALEELPARQIAGESCWAFRAAGYLGFQTLLVNEDLSHFYRMEVIEQGREGPVLQVRPAQSPEELAAAALPQGPIREE